jgi:hypothetical protein
MKHHPTATANTIAATIAVIYIVCAAFFVLAPDLSMEIAKTWFHGIDISQLDARTTTVGSFVLGLVSATIGAWGAGWLFATFSHYFSK